MYNPIFKSSKSTILIKALLISYSWEKYVAFSYDYKVNVRMHTDKTYRITST